VVVGGGGGVRRGAGKEGGNEGRGRGKGGGLFLVLLLNSRMEIHEHEAKRKPQKTGDKARKEYNHLLKDTSCMNIRIRVYS
jgi:hypothetical protein